MCSQRFAIYVALFFVLGVVGVAQERYQIQGQVAEQDGAVLPGVIVELRQNGQVVQTTSTSATGTFTFNVALLPTANHEIRIDSAAAFVPRFMLDLGQPEFQKMSSAGVSLTVRVDRAVATAPPPTKAPPPPPPAPAPGGRGTPAGRGGPPSEENHAIIKVFYATDRARTSYQPLAYSGGRNMAGRLQLGRFDVSVPRDHRLAQVERPDKWTFWREDPNKHFIMVRRTEQTYQDYYSEIAGIINQSRRKEAFVFVHGFNVPFESAVYRTAQIAYDLVFDGAPILYSWPSEGSFISYPTDLNNNEWTIPHLRWFLEDVASKTGAQMIHLIAHSMGNRALVNALNRISTEQRTTPRPKFSQVILTAPDIDADGFSLLAQAVQSGASRVTLYASSNDKALQLSKQYQGYRRAGDSSPSVVFVPGIDTIDVSAVDTSFDGHSYYGDNRSVLTDIFYLLQDAKPPSERFGLRIMGQPPRQWWLFKP